MVIKVLPAAEEVKDGPYELRLLKAPVLGGAALRAFLAVYEGPLGWQIYQSISSQSGVKHVLQDLRLPDEPLFTPRPPLHLAQPEEHCVKLVSPVTARAALDTLRGTGKGSSPTTGAPGSSSGAYRRPTIADYTQAYETGATTPVEVADRILAVIRESTTRGWGWFVSSEAEAVRRAAAASAERWAKKAPLSPLDGVPFAVKDNVHADGYGTSAGTAFMAEQIRQQPGRPEQSPCVTALQAAGGILLGKTTMHEIGLGVTGLNLRTGTAHNPYNLAHFCGGSSSGSAAVVAAGLCPIALGSDGGGSIRIPASFTGVVGLKPTNGRVPGKGGVQIDCTVATFGPLAASVEDAAIMYAVIASPAGTDVPELALPAPLSPDTPKPLNGLRAGVYWDWFNDAEPEVLAACKAALAVLEAQGLAVHPVVLPELELLRVAHNVTIVSEMAHCFQAELKDPSLRRLFNPDVRVGLATARFWTSGDYLQAQRVRRRAAVHFQRVFEEVDVLITPATACTAPAIPKGALASGFSDLGLTSLIMRFVVPANMLGLPGIAVPVGRSREGLPIAIQVLGRGWHEATVLRCAAALEHALTMQRQGDADTTPPPPPAVWLDPLTGASSIP